MKRDDVPPTPIKSTLTNVNETPVSADSRELRLPRRKVEADSPRDTRSAALMMAAAVRDPRERAQALRGIAASEGLPVSQSLQEVELAEAILETAKRLSDPRDQNAVIIEVAKRSWRAGVGQERTRLLNTLLPLIEKMRDEDQQSKAVRSLALLNTPRLSRQNNVPEEDGWAHRRLFKIASRLSTSTDRGKTLAAIARGSSETRIAATREPFLSATRDALHNKEARQVYNGIVRRKAGYTRSGSTIYGVGVKRSLSHPPDLTV